MGKIYYNEVLGVKDDNKLITVTHRPNKTVRKEQGKRFVLVEVVKESGIRLLKEVKPSRKKNKVCLRAALKPFGLGKYRTAIYLLSDELSTKLFLSVLEKQNAEIKNNFPKFLVSSLYSMPIIRHNPIFMNTNSMV